MSAPEWDKEALKEALQLVSHQRDAMVRELVRVSRALEQAENHVRELQTRGTEFVEEVRRLKAALQKVSSSDSDVIEKDRENTTP